MSIPNRCKINDCESLVTPKSARGYCPLHYRRFLTHGDANITLLKRHHGTKTDEYKVWNGVKQRCYNPNNVAYSNYGGRGIKICERWKSFEYFYTDMGQRPTPKHQLDRIDNNKGYEPGNCRWVTAKVNANNRRDNRYVTIYGQTKSLKQWCEEYEVPYDTAFNRLNRGWSEEKAILTPTNQKYTKKSLLAEE